ncbi:multidrug effflux MFS transporter [uncultured Pseudokineococcus sp.]|uniref:multidrug effflux MFS transporter n=1 Tax=uncultured Pseudokineococcus sp. TaxID=1642928 RepID=UPI002627A9B9|nr:multidrug effflux MFS transporter [uncultured Pseudokineococcus sp.]
MTATPRTTTRPLDGQGVPAARTAPPQGPDVHDALPPQAPAHHDGAHDAGADEVLPDVGASWTTAQRVRLILTLGVLVALGPLTIDMYLPALPNIGDQLLATQAQAQLTLTGLLGGLALGQLVLGPLSDRFGRRKVLLSGVATHAVASVLCSLAPTIEFLTAARVLQGVASAASAVVALAVVRDLFSGIAAARTLSRLTLVMGAAPIVAPTLGGFLLVHTSWRGVFVTLAGFAVALLVVAAKLLPETLPPERRRHGGAASVVRTYGSLLKDRRFVGLVLVAGLSFSIMFAYISGSSFVLQDLYGLSQQQYALAFGSGAVLLIGATQLNPVLAERFHPVRVMQAGLTSALVLTTTLLVLVATGTGGLFGLLVPLWLTLGSIGFVLPNGPALALTRHGRAAGTAAAVLGCTQFGIGALAAPIVGLVGGGAVGMVAVMVGAATLAVTVLMVVVQPKVLDDRTPRRVAAAAA